MMARGAVCKILINRSNVLALDYDVLLLDEILDYLKKNKSKPNPAISIYYRVLMTLKESERESHYQDLKK